MVYYIYIDLENGKHEVFNDGEVITNNNLKILQSINLSQKTWIYINHLRLVTEMFPGGVAISHGDLWLEYKYANITFRSFDAMIANNATSCLKEMYGDIPVCMQMCKYIEELGNPKKLPMTLAAYSKKMFYEPIKDDLWEETKNNKHYTYDIDTYYDMCAANKSGMKKVVKSAEYYEDVLMYDKKSAYPSVMINDNKFPIGKIKRCVTDCETALKRCLAKKEWCKVVFDGFDEHLGYLFYDEDTDKTALEYWDLWTYYIINNNMDYIFEKLKTSGRVYTVQKTGYLSKVFRDRIMYMYEEKEKCSGLKRFLVKTMLDMLYGKGLQKYQFKDKWEMQSHYRGRGDNYMCPEFSNHCAARTRYEMLKAVQSTIQAYFDTDGIKCKNTQSAKEYFEKQNEIILEANRASGYDTNIGTWKYEGTAKKLIVFRTKMYAYETDTEFEFKHAGMQKRDMQEFLDNIQGDKIDYLRLNGFDFIQRKYYYNDHEVLYGKLKTHIEGDLQ